MEAARRAGAIDMTRQKIRVPAILAFATAVLLAACASQVEPAKQAIANIESAIAAAPDAGKYVPEQLAGVQAQLADLKAAFDKKDYQAVLTRAPGVLRAAQDLLGATMLKRDEVVKQMSAEWPALAASLPGLVSKVTDRAKALAKAKHAPAGVDVAAANSAAAEAGDLWTKAQEAFKASDVETAVTSARGAKAKVEAAAAAMKMTLPAAPAAPAAGAAPAK
jgi:hypothetical protein